MKKITFILLLFSTAAGLFGQDRLSEPGQVITADEIKALGLNRLSDIFPFIDDWYYSTKDGFRYDVSASGLSHYSLPQWGLLIDGQRYDIERFGQQNINLLPVSVEQIESIEIYSKPVLIYGNFYESGLLNIVTKSPEKGLSGTARYSTGNESGDPGPYTAVDPTLINVDEIGPDFAVLLSYAADPVKLSLSANDIVNPSTDPAIYDAGSDEFRHHQLRQLGISLRSEINTNGFGSHLLHLGYTGTGDLPHSDVYGCDLLYYLPHDDYYPVKSRLIQAGLQGSFSFSKGSGLGYRTGFSSNAAHQPKYYEDTLPFRWKQLSYFGLIQYSGQVYGNPFTAGIRQDMYALPADFKYSHSNESVSITSLFGRYSFAAGSIDHLIELMLAFESDNIAVKSAYNAELRTGSNSTISMGISFTEKLPSEMTGRQRWSGVTDFYMIDSIPAPTSFCNHQAKYRLLNLDLGYEHRLSDKIIITAGGFIRHFDNMPLECLLSLRENESGESEKTYFSSPGNGLAAGGNLKFSGEIIPGLKSVTSFQYLKILDRENELFSHQYSQLPKLRIHQRLMYAFSTSAFLNVWFSAQTGGEFGGNQMPDIYLLSASFTKTFFQDRARVSLTMRNLLNNSIIYEPGAASFPLTMFFKIMLILP